MTKKTIALAICILSMLATATGTILFLQGNSEAKYVAQLGMLSVIISFSLAQKFNRIVTTKLD